MLYSSYHLFLNKYFVCVLAVSMGASESVIPKEHKTGNKYLNISRDVSHSAFIKVSIATRGEVEHSVIGDLADCVMLQIHSIKIHKAIYSR